MAGKVKYVHVRFEKSLASPTFSFAAKGEYDIERGWARKLESSGIAKILGDAPDRPAEPESPPATPAPVLQRMGKQALIAFAREQGIHVQTVRMSRGDLLTIITEELSRRAVREGEDSEETEGETGEAPPAGDGDKESGGDTGEAADETGESDQPTG